ncbi:thioredoxin family protein [Hoeflea alexandrii]|uniref:Thioredoxin fold domain-containing protein n=1 Tax=Hoeflea alexandrii TaxID=288436 RepID=A0ABT1CQ10_9HYPH|nr:thioredoxin family protein [Hoeflea alexandrii]MCO6407701.1 thioredoxin fold domain-containing protein [Hoeflea alexandrii]MCY0153919.1 thioredoxin family protein [Hoeflea alexandrii]
MIRRVIIAAVALVAFSVQAWSAEIGEDGLHKQDWFALTFRDVAEDIEAAKDEGKRLVMVFEQRGCIYCAKMHEDLLSDPEVSDFIKANFKVVQYNMFGDEEVTDLDGDVLTEKTAARKWGYVFTPTLVFLPEEAPEGMTVAEAAVATMPGAFGKWTFLNMFKWVAEKGYDSDEHFQKYHARIINELRAQGRLEAE